MKKTVNINLSGQSFVIDEDAYEMLEEYLSTLKRVFSANGEADITNDIESHMAEIFFETPGPAPAIISIDDAENVIRRIGRPEEILAEVDEAEVRIEERDDKKTDVRIETESVSSKGSVPPPLPPLPVRKRLYRDPRNKLLGGVCSGLGWYLNVDPVWVRLVTAGLCFLSMATVAIAYVIFWIIIPEARTPIEQLQMRGESPTMSNIGKVVTANFKSEESDIADGDYGNRHRFLSTFNEMVSVLAKILMAVVGTLSIPVLIAMLIGFVTLVFISLIFAIPSLQALFPQWAPEEVALVNNMPYAQTGIWCVLGWILAIGIPVFALAWLCFKGLSNRPVRLNRAAKFSMITMWIIGCLIAIFTTATLHIHDIDIDEIFDDDQPAVAVTYNDETIYSSDNPEKSEITDGSPVRINATISSDSIVVNSTSKSGTRTSKINVISSKTGSGNAKNETKDAPADSVAATKQP